MLQALLTATTLALTPTPDTPTPSIEEAFAELKALTLALDDGEAIFHYTMCFADPRLRDLRDAWGALQAQDLYPQFAAMVDAQRPSLFRELSPDEVDRLTTLVSAEVGDRLGVVGCELTLVPSPTYMERLAEEAHYMRAAMNGEIDPAANYRREVDLELDVLESQDNGDLLLTVNACYAFTPIVDQPRFGVRMEDIAADPARLTAELETLGPQIWRMRMADRLFDKKAVWREAVADRVSEPSPSHCQALFAEYARPEPDYDL